MFLPFLKAIQICNVHTLTSDTLQALLNNGSTFFSENDTQTIHNLHYRDHMTSFRGDLIKPDGYLLLQSKNAISDEPELDSDALVQGYSTEGNTI